MTWYNFNLQDSMSPMMYSLIYLYEYIMMFLTIVMSLLYYFVWLNLFTYFYSNKIINNQTIETLWTIYPLIILIMLAFPSIKILYMNDELISPNMSIKATANQWYWSYDYPQFNNMNFDSYLLSFNENSNFRLLDVNNRTTLPLNTKIRVLTSSNDVIHSFAIPSLGIKMDSIPGRINQTTMFMSYTGLMYGQCSEICGMNHSFMPIVIESISVINFIKWTSM